ncbi:hypothetical protein BROOK1789C_2237, partial [Bathymodiolus brooksi thiotrophic gill symbiont]
MHYEWKHNRYMRSTNIKKQIEKIVSVLNAINQFTPTELVILR